MSAPSLNMSSYEGLGAGAPTVFDVNSSFSRGSDISVSGLAQPIRSESAPMAFKESRPSAADRSPFQVAGCQTKDALQDQSNDSANRSAVRLTAQVTRNFSLQGLHSSRFPCRLEAGEMVECGGRKKAVSGLLQGPPKGTTCLASTSVSLSRPRTIRPQSTAGRDERTRNPALKTMSAAPKKVDNGDNDRLELERQIAPSWLSRIQRSYDSTTRVFKDHIESRRGVPCTSTVKM